MVFDLTLRTFNETNHYQLTHIGPIDVDTILKLDAANGKVLNSWGASLFFFPHGMTIDHHGNIWVSHFIDFRIAFACTVTLHLMCLFNEFHRR